MRRGLVFGAVFALWGGMALAQTPMPPPAATRPGRPVQAEGPISLSYERAVQLALENNLQALLARERVNEARGEASQARAGLFPELSGGLVQRSETINLAALGFQKGLFPGNLPTLIGPFRNFDARAQLVQNIFDMRAIRRAQAGSSDIRLSALEEQLARRQVIARTAIAYLGTISADRAVEAARANLELARSLRKLAEDQRTAGIATGVDVTRADTRLAAEQVRVAQAETEAQRARLHLLRTVGLPLGSEATLTDALAFNVESLPAAEDVAAEAARERLEIRIAEEQVRMSGFDESAARAERLPSLAFVADYGESGITPSESAVPTRTYGVRLNIPLFNPATSGRIQVAHSRRRQAELRLDDTRLQVEEDVRLARQTVASTAEQVRAARQSASLAERELQMARDRFAAGVADNLEVVNAQTALANAREAEVAALAQYNAARINLAAARGRIEGFHW